MKKHLLFKACVLLIVMFFHSFVLVPKTYATVTGQSATIIRQLYRAVPPSTLIEQITANTGKAALIGWRLASGVGLAYMLYQYGALDPVKDWLSSQLDPQNISPPPWGNYNTWSAATGSWQYRTTQNGPGCIYFQVNSNTGTGWPGGTAYQWVVYMSCAQAGDISSFVSSHGGSALLQPPTVTTDYGSTPNGSISIPDGTVFGTPGAAANLTGGETPQSVTLNLTQAEADALKAALGMTNINPSTGEQDGIAPATDNTVTAGDAASIGLLQQIATYTSNLIGIKDSATAIKTNTDNLVAGQSVQTTAIQSMSGKMDNIAIAINNQTALDNAMLGKMDNMAQTIDSLKNTTETESTLSSRLTGVKTLLLTKFPFSVVAAVTAPGAVTGGTYTIPDLHFPLDVTVSVDPMQNEEIADWIGWVRGLMAIGMWSIFILVMIRRVTEI